MQYLEYPMNDASAQVAHNGVFGVGAPEALLVGVVALVVFGPQGLIDVRPQQHFKCKISFPVSSFPCCVLCLSLLHPTTMQAAKTVASTIRAVQPTIQELNQATTDIRTSITKEVGIDTLQKEFREIQQTTRDSLRLDTPSFSPPVPDPTPTVLTSIDDENAADKEGGKYGVQSNGAAENGASEGFSEEERKTLTAIAEEINKEDDQTAKSASSEGEDLEKMRADSATMAWAGQAQSSEDATGKSVKKRLEDMTMAELQGELSRRKEMIKRIHNLN